MTADFIDFAKPVAARFAEMSKGELYVVDLDGDELWAAYLAAFPPGTDPIFRERTEHDCQTCKRFVRNLGRVVTVKDGAVTTVWADFASFPEPYRTVAAALDALVKSRPVKTVFRSKERTYGEPHNYDPKTNQRYDHFHGRVADRHFSADADTKRGEKEAVFQVLSRGLVEIRESDLETVLDLINSNGLYRGEEHKPAVEGFLALSRQLSAIPDGGWGRVNFVWENLDHKYARFRNTVIGTLLTDLAEGKELEQAVKAFETKVAPTNYKRPTAVITQRMVEEAVAKLHGLGLSGATNRRYARLSDISVNDVLFVDRAVRSRMKGADPLAALLADAVKKSAPDLSRAEKVSADDFVRDVLPGAKSLELFLENRHQGNFVSLTGADGPERPFRWPNNFAWAYDGDLADSELRRRVQELGGRVDGVLRFSHRWNYDKRNASLMDLHVFMPGSSHHREGCHDEYPTGPRVGWNRRSDAPSGGNQDVDYTTPAPEGYIPVENITFPSMDRLREGEYVFKIHNWSLRPPTQGGFQAEIEFGGQVFKYEMTRPLKQKEWVTVATATLKGGVFTIEHALPSSKTSQQKWGVNTETLVPVEVVCHSPNHWGGSAAGAKHLIFALQGCKNPGQARGIFNEYLDSRLAPHAKVFEVLASRTKVAYSDEQVSGVGFTAARGDSVVVVVTAADGRRQTLDVRF